MTRAELLQGYIESVSSKPFSWERHNCIHFTGGWVMVATGLDRVSGKEMPKTALDVRRALRAARCESLMEAVCSELGAGIEPSRAAVGDIVLTHDNALGICNGRVSFVLFSGGVAAINTLGVAAAWRV